MLAEHRESRPRLDQVDPIEVVIDVLEGYESLAEELALLAERTRHDGVRLGAIKARLETHRARIDLLQAAGALPADLAQLRTLQDVDKVVDTIMFVFADEGVPERAQRRIADVLRGSGGGRSIARRDALDGGLVMNEHG